MRRNPGVSRRAGHRTAIPRALQGLPCSTACHDGGADRASHPSPGLTAGTKGRRRRQAGASAPAPPSPPEARTPVARLRAPPDSTPAARPTPPQGISPAAAIAGPAKAPSTPTLVHDAAPHHHAGPPSRTARFQDRMLLSRNKTTQRPGRPSRTRPALPCRAGIATAATLFRRHRTSRPQWRRR